jgi:uncharacterized membrane protein (DUF106 family)
MDKDSKATLWVSSGTLLLLGFIASLFIVNFCSSATEANFKTLEEHKDIAIPIIKQGFTTLITIIIFLIGSLTTVCWFVGKQILGGIKEMKQQQRDMNEKLDRVITVQSICDSCSSAVEKARTIEAMERTHNKESGGLFGI